METAAEQIPTLIRQYAGALELFAAQWTRFPADAVQEAFIGLAEQQPLPTNPRAWLYKVVRFKAMDCARSESRRRKYETQLAEAREDWFVESTASQLEATETVNVLKELPIEQREVIVARIWGGLSFREIAEFTDTSNSTCHRRYQDGIEALKNKLEKSPCQTP